MCLYKQEDITYHRFSAGTMGGHVKTKCISGMMSNILALGGGNTHLTMKITVSTPSIMKHQPRILLIVTYMTNLIVYNFKHLFSLTTWIQ